MKSPWGRLTWLQQTLDVNGCNTNEHNMQCDIAMKSLLVWLKFGASIWKVKCGLCVDEMPIVGGRFGWKMVNSAPFTLICYLLNMEIFHSKVLVDKRVYIYYIRYQPPVNLNIKTNHFDYIKWQNHNINNSYRHIPIRSSHTKIPWESPPHGRRRPNGRDMCGTGPAR